MSATTGRTRRRSGRGHAHGQVPREVREDQLLEVAERLFLAHGYVGTAIGEVASAAGRVSSPSTSSRPPMNSVPASAGDHSQPG